MLRTLGAVYISNKEVHVSRGTVEDIDSAVALIVYDEDNVRIVSLTDDDYQNDLLCQLEQKGSL